MKSLTLAAMPAAGAAVLLACALATPARAADIQRIYLPTTARPADMRRCRSSTATSANAPRRSRTRAQAALSSRVTSIRLPWTAKSGSYRCTSSTARPRWWRCPVRWCRRSAGPNSEFPTSPGTRGGGNRQTPAHTAIRRPMGQHRQRRVIVSNGAAAGVSRSPASPGRARLHAGAPGFTRIELMVVHAILAVICTALRGGEAGIEHVCGHADRTTPAGWCRNKLPGSCRASPGAVARSGPAR